MPERRIGLPYDKLIYVAGPYRGDVDGNIKRAEAAAVELWRRGWAVICPHKNTAHFEQYENVDSISAGAWLQGDLTMLQRCNAMFLLKGWENSDGSVEEFRHAIKWDIPVFYQSDDYPEPYEVLPFKVTKSDLY